MLISCKNILTRRIITIATEDLNVVLANCDNITNSEAPELDSFKFRDDFGSPQFLIHPIVCRIKSSKR